MKVNEFKSAQYIQVGDVVTHKEVGGKYLVIRYPDTSHSVLLIDLEDCEVLCSARIMDDLGSYKVLAKAHNVEINLLNEI